MASRDAFENDGQNHHTGTQNMARLLGDTLDTQGHINSSNINSEAIEYLNSPINVVKLAQWIIGNGKKGFANASDYLETWDDSDSITAANTQKDLRHAATWLHNHLESQYQGSEASYEHTEVVELN